MTKQLDTHVLLYINKQRFVVTGNDAELCLADFLRKVSLVGTKIVCAEGDCGACTVLIGSPLGAENVIQYRKINSCILPIYLLDGFHVVTVEGLSMIPDLHPAQYQVAKEHGSQCGYCTPGTVCALADMFDSVIAGKEEITRQKIKNHLTGNLCRCTGYEPIIQALEGFDLTKVPRISDFFHNPIRNTELLESSKVSKTIKTDESNIFIPHTLTEALEFKSRHPEARVVAGATDTGVLINKKNLSLNKVLVLNQIIELKHIELKGNFLEVGAQATLSDLQFHLKHHFDELYRLLHRFASPQIKNQATLGGNIINASPIADSLPFLMIAEAELEIESLEKKAQIKISDFYLGYKKLNMNPLGILSKIRIPILRDYKIKLYKVSNRMDLDISTVTFAGAIKLKDGLVVDCRLALGGVGPTVFRLPDIEKSLINAPLSFSLWQEASNRIVNSISPLSDVRGSQEYRKILCQNLILRFFHDLVAVADKEQNESL